MNYLTNSCRFVFCAKSFFVQTVKMSTGCSLVPLELEQAVIHLEEGKNVLGRSRETGIRDIRCSKEQVQLHVNLKTKKIDVQVLGLNPSCINGVMALQHTKCVLQHGDFIEIVYGRHKYSVKFDLENNDIRATVNDDWQAIDNNKLLVYTSAGVKASSKIAGYDMDWTLIKTRSGKVFPKNNDDWEIMYGQIPAKLRQLHEDGFKICIFTNQGGIGRGKITENEFRQKVAAIKRKLGVPLQLFAATSDGIYRKPAIGMWMYLRDTLNENIELQLEKCFYVGDAAGRDEVGKRRKDHSLVDRLFALNIGVAFYTPEVHFLDHKDESWNPPLFEPKKLLTDVPLFDPPNIKFPADHCELIIMVGLPGAGKTHFCKQHAEKFNYKIVNADTLGKMATCLKMCENALSSRQSCIVDNTNVTAEARVKFLDIAKRMNIPCRCFVMNVEVPHAKHNIVFRQLTDTSHSKINDMVFNGMKKRYLPPTLDEGFTSIVSVNWKPTFNNEKDEQLFSMHLLEK